MFIELALVKKKKMNQTEADKFTRRTLQGDVDEILQDKEQIEMDDILKTDDKVCLVVVEGAPGMGKSTLAWELCRQWPTLESLKRFSLVVLLRLQEEGVQSAKDLSNFFPCGDDPGLSRLVAQEVKGGNGKGVLFVFDGFDELLPSQRKSLDSLVMQVIVGECLPEATILVTSRPSATADLQPLLKKTIAKCIEIIGFSEERIHKYAESIFGEDSKTLENFNGYVSTNPVVKGMMYNPLNCAIVVGVYQDTYESGKPVPHTQTMLYTELTLCLLSRNLDLSAEKLPNKLEDLPHELKQQLVELGKFAFEGKQDNTVIFKKLPKGCRDLGLLVKHTTLYTDKASTTYNFFHLTLQEYMSAFYISQLPADTKRTLFAKYNSTSMEVVWRFVAGLTKMQKIGWDGFNRDCEVEYNMLLVGPFLLECLYEAQDVQSCERVFRQYKIQFTSQLSNYSLYALGYCISVCSKLNTWNVMHGIYQERVLRCWVMG